MGVVADAGERCRCSFVELTGELQYFRKRFWNGCLGGVGTCGILDGDCG